MLQMNCAVFACSRDELRYLDDHYMLYIVCVRKEGEHGQMYSTAK